MNTSPARSGALLDEIGLWTNRENDSESGSSQGAASIRSFEGVTVHGGSRESAASFILLRNHVVGGLNPWRARTA